MCDSYNVHVSYFCPIRQFFFFFGEKWPQISLSVLTLDVGRLLNVQRCHANLSSILQGGT